MSNQRNDEELLWRQYNLLSGLYTFYLDLIIKANLFLYGITGGIVTIVFANSHVKGIRWSLLLPFLFCVAFVLISFRGAKEAKEFRNEIFRIRDILNIRLAPHVDILVLTLLATGIIYIIVAIGIAVFFLSFNQMLAE